MKVKPAERTGKVQEYYFSQKLAQIDRMRKEGADIINLGIGSPDQSPSELTICNADFICDKDYLTWLSELYRSAGSQEGICRLVQKIFQGGAEPRQ